MSDQQESQDISDTLAERGSRYGDFWSHARITQDLKVAMRQGNWLTMGDDQREALEMVAHKVGRILNGDPNYRDSWHDIVGYTKLVADRLAVDRKVRAAAPTEAGGDPALVRIERAGEPKDYEWEEANEDLLCHVGELQEQIAGLRDVVRGFVAECDGLQPFRYPGNAVYDRIASLVRRAREALIEGEDRL